MAVGRACRDARKIRRVRVRALGPLLQKARQRMQKAEENLKDNKRKEAIEEQQQADGSTRLDVIVEKIEAYMSRSIAIGSGLAPTLERRYGLNPAAGVYR